MNITIRNLQSSDTEIIKFMKERLSLRWKTSAEEIDREYILPSFDGGFPYIFIAFTSDGEFAGKIILSIEKNHFLGIDKELWINGLFVVEKFRCQGVGRKLIAKAEEMARLNGYKALYLDTTQAVEYYLKLGGWHVFGTDFYKDQEVIIMKKDL